MSKHYIDIPQLIKQRKSLNDIATYDEDMGDGLKEEILNVVGLLDSFIEATEEGLDNIQFELQTASCCNDNSTTKKAGRG
jgi:hypothetical protein